ncbi:hypothetical protein EYF80_064722 [Liparis tanakae]|uniref:Uncharacterized protein n=1 Tax=Liparis tanakae TaxID=230148 RepID=A0A4Z2E999_9TELE|nr:hypothetical protein EYF80_064722 [Liparis tanakae]
MLRAQSEAEGTRARTMSPAR